MRKKMFQQVSLALAMVLMTGCTVAKVSEPVETTASEAVETAVASETEAASDLPKIGDSSFGFTVKDMIPMKQLGATGILYEHEKSGASLLYLDSEDTNRSFSITFRTPALDDKGMPHVFEHITIGGSQKYPDANMTFPVFNQTYNTYINAYTAHGMTSYPIATLSEKQMMTLMDYYLSGVFQPLLYTEPRLVQREAWRYELSDADADINIAGTVYSEMQGALTLSDRARNNNDMTLFEGSSIAHEYGGDPDVIPDLTYEELVDFHDTYYHPSNALIMLYGDLNIDQFLEYIDREYLSGYDKKNIDVDRGKVEPYTETKYAEYEVPVEQGAATEHASIIYYSFALNGIDLKDVLSVKILNGVMSQESSPIMKAVRKKLPDAQITIDTDYDTPSAPYCFIKASGVDPEDQEQLEAAVDEGLSAMASEGISEDALDAILAIKKLELLTTREDVNLGVDAGQLIALAWTYFDSLDYYPTQEQAIEEMTKERADALLKKYFANNRHRAVSVTKPTAGLAEQKAAALAAKLAEKKAAMSREEIDAMVQDSKDFMEWSNTPVSPEILSQILNVKVTDLPEEQRHYEVADETRDDVRWMSTAVDVNDVISGRILLDGGNIPIESLQDVQTALQLIGKLDTKQHSKEEISTLRTRYLANFSSALAVKLGYSDKGYYVANLPWIGMTEDAEASMELLAELLFQTDYSDTAVIKSFLTRWNSEFTNGMDESRLGIQLQRVCAMDNDYYAYREYVNDYEQYAHRQELIALADSDPAELTKRLEAARNLILNRNGAIVEMAGSTDAIAAYSTGVQNVLDQMTGEVRSAVDYSALRIPKQNEGMVVNSTVQMNMLAEPYSDFVGRDFVVKSLIDDMYMLPKLRNGLGAYGAYSYLDHVIKMLYTYRDPNLESSYDIFAELPEYLRTTELTQEDVDRYIIGSYGSIYKLSGLMDGGMKAMDDRLFGYSEELRLQWMKEAKATTVENIRATAGMWEELLKSGVRSTSGTESTLKAAGNLFDVMLYPDGTVKEVKQ